MISKIVDGICEALNEEFGEAYEIYTEDVRQGLREPCFSVKLLEPTSGRFLGKRYYTTNHFCVHYFSKSQTAANDECYDVLERLFGCLEYINVGGDLTAGTAMSGEVADGVLSFFVNYNMFLLDVSEEQINMETVEQTMAVKE